MARILLGVTGGIAAYKAVELVRLADEGRPLRARGADARVPELRRHARRSRASQARPCSSSEFEADPARGAYPGDPAPGHDAISHLELVARADVFAIAPGVGEHDRQARRRASPTTC